MTARRPREIELSVERELHDAAGISRRVRLTARFPLEEGTAAPEPGELSESLRDLDHRLERAGTAAGWRGAEPRSERSLEELVETYRPRQPELIELLLADGEISEPEAHLLRRSLGGDRPTAPVPSLAPAGPPPTSLAAMPLSNDRSPVLPRPVPELLELYRIGTLKQAGAVRARRQISFDEYMALKRHFAVVDGGAAPAGGGGEGP